MHKWHVLWCMVVGATFLLWFCPPLFGFDPLHPAGGQLGRPGGPQPPPPFSVTATVDAVTFLLTGRVGWDDGAICSLRRCVTYPFEELRLYVLYGRFWALTPEWKIVP